MSCPGRINADQVRHCSVALEQVARTTMIENSLALDV